MATPTPNCDKPGQPRWFPINRRHQRMATPKKVKHFDLPEGSFQSIGVTKEWRHWETKMAVYSILLCFQSIGVTKEWRLGHFLKRDHWLLEKFPINRRHQRMATPSAREPGDRCGSCRFPINRRHQRMATTLKLLRGRSIPSQGFQSIGVTKEWRLP